MVYSGRAAAEKAEVNEDCTSTSIHSELEYGVAKSAAREKNRFALAEFLTAIEILPYDDQASVEYGDIRTDLEKRGKPIGPLDTLI